MGGSGTYVNQLIVTEKVQAFRTRATSPKSGEYRFMQCGYSGQLSARGGVIELRRPDDPLNLATSIYSLVVSQSYAGLPTQPQLDLRITELNYAPSAPSTAELAAVPGVQAKDFEYTELINTGANTLNLAGAEFQKGVAFTFPAAAVSTIGPGERRLVVGNLTAFRARYGALLDAIILGEFEGTLDNAGEQLQLVDNVGEGVLDFDYSPAWYPPTDAGGRTLVTRVANTSHMLFGKPIAWAISGAVGGTPGADDAGYANHYTGWRWDYFSSGELTLPSTLGDLTSDPDGDGLNNFTEYAFAHHPRVADYTPLATPGPWPVSGSDYLSITFKRHKDAIDMTYKFEATGNLQRWPDSTTLVSTTDLGNGTQSVTFCDNTPIGPNARYLRVRATK